MSEKYLDKKKTRDSNQINLFKDIYLKNINDFF